MGGCSAVSKVCRRAKCLLLLVLSLGVLAWISTFAGEKVKAIQDGSRSLWKNEIGLRLHMYLWKNRTSAVSHRTQAPKETCPQPSPLLRGTLKLSFDPALTMKDLEHDNRVVLEGQYQPPDCIAQQRVAVLIPHRNREKHLLYLLHHLHPFLQRQQLHYGIYVIHQAGDVTFNRAKLLNVGYLEALKDLSWDCFILHDVDLVPENDHNLYTCDQHPKHLVVGRNVTGYRLRYKGYFGGVTALTKEQFLQVNGFSNSYWGWGGEDDDLRIRVELQKMKIVRPPAEVARYTMVFHKRDSGNAVNKNRMALLKRTRLVWHKDGLNSCSYKNLFVQRTPTYINITVDIGKP
ncbi:beta-1,4-galactosyltransferase 4 [Denticeps clupeoides]|uniref:Beta-1,4-galactosyltransferase n=1 Tax=Denticeps clupeoides TaxID=299321 RepID=A0AAY4BLA2_9TELE|nr:beta-1,4-galactosyltransferase 4 [Denticeps clupeoides]XP_028839097.1 beta-1,4-galactosyltransferase 4 [Denticeps clupeoides]XP_028839098.1 beta-1,4-galactosyltransferase 4 [Denticeps clupeoides]